MTGFNRPTTAHLQGVWARIAAPGLKRMQSVLSCGLTPQKLALTLCVGSALGVMPLLWGTSLLCILVAYIFRLNQVALQSVNYLLYPIQLALLLPFLKLGIWLFPWGPVLPQQIFTTLFHDPGAYSLKILCWITLKSLAAWLITVIPTVLIAYGIQRVASPSKMPKHPCD